MMNVTMMNVIGSKELKLIIIATLETVVEKISVERMKYLAEAENNCGDGCEDAYIRYMGGVDAIDDVITSFKSDIVQLMLEIKQSDNNNHNEK